MLPFNIELMKLTTAKLSALKPVTALEPFDGGSNQFHEGGLYSISIFGRIGDTRRDNQFSYIKLNTTILHPVIYNRLCKLKGLYKGILSGKAYATYDKKINDFVVSTELLGDTGYAFFMRHWKTIVFKPSKSAKRTMAIALIEKYKEVGTVTNALVLPAGLRDLEVDESGRKRENEINDLYRRLLRISNGIAQSLDAGDANILNSPRHSLQLTFNEVYKTLEAIIVGKKGFIQAKWGSRGIVNGTRNVITAMDTSAEDLNEANKASFTSTELGLFQMLKGALPLAVFLIKDTYLRNIFLDGELSAKLINKNTYLPVRVTLTPKTYDRWSTTEGLGKVIHSLADAGHRSQPVIVDEHYLSLIYLGFDNTFKIFSDVTLLPEHIRVDLPGKPPVDKPTGELRPITYGQLAYLSGYHVWNTLKVFVTRYPIASIGSVYPSDVYARTTVVGHKRSELGDDWKPIDSDHVALEFPSLADNPPWMDSQVVHPTRLQGLGGDYDGDTCSGNIVYSDDAIAEVNKMMGKKEMWLDGGGGFKASTNYDTVRFVLTNMTGTPVPPKK